MTKTFDDGHGVANTTDESWYRDQVQYDPAAGIKPFVQEAKKGETPKTVAPYNLTERRLIDSKLTERAIDFMERSVNSEKPFFAYIPFTQPHIPTWPHPDFHNKTGNGHYADVLAEMDHRAGELLDAIDRLGIRDNTIVIWTSDNGPEEARGFQGTAGILAWQLFYRT